MMKNILSPLACLLLSLLTFSLQAQNRDLDQDIDTYLGFNRDLDFASLVTYVHPALFEVTGATPEMMIEVMESSMATEDFNMYFSDMSVQPYATIQEGEKSFALIPYTFTMVMDFRGEDSLSMAQESLSLMQLSFGDDNVILDESTAALNIQAEKQMFGFLTPEFDHWMFLEANESARLMLGDLMSEDLENRLKAALAKAE